MFKPKPKKLALLLLIVIVPTLLALASILIWFKSGPYVVISAGFVVVEAWVGCVLFSIFALLGYAFYRYLCPRPSGH